MKTSAASNTRAPGTGYRGSRRGQSERRQWDRREAAARLRAWDVAKERGLGERDAAEDAGAARSTVRRWEQRREGFGVAPEVAAFFESPEGVAVLERIVWAVAFIVDLLSGGGLRLVQAFLELSGMDAFVAPSVGNWQKLMVAMEGEVGRFGEEQRSALGPRMPAREITLLEDETFHPKICLVAMDAVSGFILVEEYAERRDTETWNAAVARQIEGLNVEVIQTTTDEAKALIAHAKQQQDANHSPDVFHVQYGLSRAIAPALSRRVQRAEEALEAAMRTTEQTNIDQKAYEAERHGPGRPPDFAGRIAAAEEAEAEARQQLETTTRDREEARQARAQISAVYHPYTLEDGKAQSAETVAARLEEQLVVLEGVAARAGLSDKQQAAIGKARRTMPGMVGTIRFVHRKTTGRLDALNIEDNTRQEVAGRLVPGLYLQVVARRAGRAEERHRLTAVAEGLLAPLRAATHPLQLLPEDRRREIIAVAQGCADLFQRSSSPVEGRNGQLSLQHHGHHNLPPRKLNALTVVHNYFLLRADGTTAGERFFGAAPDDLFEWLLSRMPPLPRPRRRRGRVGRSRSPQLHPVPAAS